MPNFPAEIWREIFRISVEIPQSLETKWNHAPNLIFWEGWKPRDYFLTKYRYNSIEMDYRMKLQTKRSIVQVSRTWRDIGVEFLYEHLFFGPHDEELKPMAMIASIFEQHSNEFAYGWATKHIDIPVRALSPPTIPIVMRLLTACHNLRVLTFERDYGKLDFLRCDPNDLSDLASLLQSRFSHSLRRMVLNLNFSHVKGGGYDDPIEYHRFLPNLPLDSLEIGTRRLSIQEPFATTTVSALTIKDVVLDSIEIVPWNYPALRHLTLIGIALHNARTFYPFLNHHGQKLFSLALFPASEGIEETHGITNLISPATNLRCLVFDLLHASDLLHDVGFPSITHLGIRTESLRWRNRSPPNPIYDSSQFPHHSIFPNLECLRFLDISDERPLWLLDIAQNFNHARVEDQHCRPIF